MEVVSTHDFHDQQPRRRRKGPGELRCEKERAARPRADAAQDQNAKTTSDNINELTAAADSNDGNIEKCTDGAVEAKNGYGAVLVPTDQVESDGTTKDIAEEKVVIPRLSHFKYNNFKIMFLLEIPMLMSMTYRTIL